MESEFNKFDWSVLELATYKEKLSLIKSYVQKNISEENFIQLYTAFYWIIDKVALPQVILKAEYLLRGRLNMGQNFSEEWQISYNTKNKASIEAGRFNRPKESVFYATIPTENENKNANVTLTACLECDKELVGNNSLIDRHDITIGEWNLKEPFTVINLCYDKTFLKNNKWHSEVIEESFKNLAENLPASSIGFIKEFWEYLSRLAANKAESSQQHFMTTAFFCALRVYFLHEKNETIHGIVYPSTMTDNVGLNVVLTTDAVEKFIELKKVFVERLVKDITNKEFYHCIRCTEKAEVKNHKFHLCYW